MNMPKRLINFLGCLLVGLLLSACSGGGGGGGGGEAAIGDGQGSLSVFLTDSSTDEYQAVYVTVALVDVQQNEGDAWITVAEPNQTYNLLELVNGVRENLGAEPLASGHYTQMRLIIGEQQDAGVNLLNQPHPYANYVIDQDDDEVHELKVPSGTQTGLKIVNGFDINENQTTELVLDFDALRSVVKAGNSGQYLLKPTVKVLYVIDYALVNGTVTDTAVTPAALPGSLVMAQTADGAAADVKDQVIIETGTVADESGGYTLTLPAGGYNLVAAKDGYHPDCTAVSLLEDSTTTVDFQLIAATEMGSIAGTVTIAATPGEQYATIDFRQAADCGAGATTVTVASVNIGDGGQYEVALPLGNYTVVAAADGQTTQTAVVTVANGIATPNDINFLIP